MKPNISETTYELLELLPTIALFSLGVSILTVYLIAIICCLSLKKFDTVISSYKTLSKLLTKLMMMVFGPGGRSVLHYKRHEDTEIDALQIPVIYIHKRRVPTGFVVMFELYVASFILFSVTVFWDIFLLTESNDCDDTTIDCFAQVAGNDTILPIYDCKIYENHDANVTISCFTFTYSLGRALAAIGGLLNMIDIIMKGIAGTFLCLYGYAVKSRKKCILYLIISLQILMAVVVPFAILVGITVYVKSTTYSLSLSYTSIAQLVLGILTLVFGFSIPWMIFVYPDKENDENHHSNNIPLSLTSYVRIQKNNTEEQATV